MSIIRHFQKLGMSHKFGCKFTRHLNKGENTICCKNSDAHKIKNNQSKDKTAISASESPVIYSLCILIRDPELKLSYEHFLTEACISPNVLVTCGSVEVLRGLKIMCHADVIFLLILR